MARIKFSVFAVACIALACAGLVSLSRSIASRASIEATERLGWGQTLFETSGKLAQAYRAAAISSAASDAKLQSVVAGLQGSAPSAEAIDAARAAASTALATLPEEIRNAAALLLGNEQGVAMIPAGGAAPEALAKEAFALDAAASAGPQGTYALVDGKLFRVVAAPVRAGGRSAAILGAAWALDDAYAAAQARETTLGVTLVAGDVVVSSLKGPERTASARAHNGPLAVGSFASLGPVSLPLFAGRAARYETRSFPLEGIEGARAVLTAEASGLVALADLQKTMVLGIGGLLLLALAFLLLMPASSEAVARVGAPAPAQAEPTSARSEPAIVLGGAPASPEPVVTPDDFPFGDSAHPEPSPAPQPEAVAAQPEPTTQPGAVPPSVPEPAAVQPEPAPTFAPEPAEALAQAAIPMPGPGAFASAAPSPADQPFDPFAAAAAQMQEEEQSTNHEATVVSAVPEELLRAATRARPASAPSTTPVATPAPALDTIPLPSPRPSAAPAPAADPEEAHFLDVFNQFIATRSQCNEPSDGLTAERFVAKLRKNKEQLIQKYSCRSVRFQVYVKDGKAALKATPIKD